jgi:iron complex transport system ATP-binding protein
MVTVPFKEGLGMQHRDILLQVENLACGYRRRTVVGNVSFSVAASEFLCLLGPNGVGKTTLFKTLLRLLPSTSGRILLKGEDVAGWPHAKFAAMVGYVPQAHMPAFPFQVIDVVAMGRTAHLGPLGTPSRHDMELAEQALDTLSIAHLRHRPCTEISGGERQLALLARALVQQPAILVLDEPTSNLDFGNQVRVLDHVSRLAEDQGLGVIMTTHDPNHALLHASQVATIDRDGSFSVGRPEDVVTEDYLRRTYGVHARIVDTPLAGSGIARMCLPLRRPMAEVAE